jgi:hypothetical protein
VAPGQASWWWQCRCWALVGTGACRPALFASRSSPSWTPSAPPAPSLRIPWIVQDSTRQMFVNFKALLCSSALASRPSVIVVAGGGHRLHNLSRHSFPAAVCLSGNINIGLMSDTMKACNVRDEVNAFVNVCTMTNKVAASPMGH